MRRVSFSMREDLYERVAKRADNLSISVSSYVSMACVEKLRNDEILESFPDAIGVLKSFQTSQHSDEKEKQS